MDAKFNSMKKKIGHWKSSWALVIILFVASAIAYLPLASQIGFLNDDWYLMYDAHTQGASYFHQVYNSDRPARAYVMEAAYDLFGDNTFDYQLSGYLFRFLSAISFFWILAQIWPHRRQLNFSATLLFLLYPGFLSQVNPIDYQSQLFSLCLAMVSIALTIAAIRSSNLSARILFTILSILLGIEYLALVEYFIGFEVLRFAIVFLLFSRSQEVSLRQKILQAFWGWLPFAAAPGAFLIWRFFIFQTARRATDIGFQLGQLFSSPLVGLWWFVYMVQDVINTLFVAWVFPLYSLAFQMRLRDTLIGFGLAAFVVLLVVAGLRWGREAGLETDASSNSGWMREAYWVGFVTIVAGLAPVIFANRHVSFPDYSRYTLAASVGVAILIAAIIANLSSRALQTVLLSFLVAVSVVTHYANSVNAVAATSEIRNFWWQVAWRAPTIRAGTTLVASYPEVGIQEDYFVWGPANLIYYPEKQNQLPIEIKLPAAVLSDGAVLQILTDKGLETPERRGNVLSRDFSDVLFIVQTARNGCVRVIDGNVPELSSQDSQRTMLVAPHSQIDNVIPDSNFATPPVSIFGPEPTHDWCYYYESAALARQRGNWSSIPGLRDEALSLGFYPNDSVEWMPFLQAYTVLGDLEGLRSLKNIILADRYLTQETCQILTGMTKTYEIAPDVQSFVQKSFCE